MALKLKKRTAFPAHVTAAAPLLMDKNGVRYDFSIDVADLADQVAEELTDVFVPVNTTIPVYNVAYYVARGQTAQDACDAAEAAGGGIVYFPSSYNLGSGAKGLDLDGYSLIRLMGPGGPNGGAAEPVYLVYGGTGSAISCDNSYGIDISGLFIWCTAAGAININGDNSANISVHDNVIYNANSSASSVGITLNVSQNACIGSAGRNTIVIAGGVGIRGVPSGGSFSVGTKVENNKFLTATKDCIEGPGQVWTVAGNVAQNPGETFIKKGPAGTCDVLNVYGNDIDDITGGAGKTLITSNASVLNSKGNRFGYVSGTVTCISQDNSTGTVNSDCDRLSGTVGIAIGTGNYLSIESAVGGLFAPTTLYTGTPANTDVVKTIGGPANITGQLGLGLSGSYRGSVRLWTTTAGAHNTVLQPTDGATGLVTQTLPSVSGNIINDAATQTITGAKTFGAAGNVGKLRVAGNTSGTTTLDATAVAGSTTLTLPAATDTLVARATTDTLSTKTLDNTCTANLKDTLFTLQDDGDATKTMRFQLSGIATGTLRTVTVPNSDISLPGTNIANTWSTTQTFTVAPVFTDASGTRTALGLAIGTNVQAFDAQLFSNIPQNSKSAAYTTVLTDGSKHIFHPSADTTARTWTIDSNANVAYPVGTAITFINQNGAGVITISITSDTMRLAGTGATGNRTLAPNGVATAIKVATTEWIISGTGVS